jgi:DNA polymerase I-like protein with 3'-5' exonuclease and polymerase domains
VPWIDTADLQPDTPLSNNESYWIYNGLDAMVTYEVLEAQEPVLERFPECRMIADFEMAMLGPAMDMMRRGFKVDLGLRDVMLLDLGEERAKLEARLNALAECVWHRPLNARSPKQLLEFFQDYLRIPVPIKRVKGEEKQSLDRKVLEGLRGYHYAKPFVGHILAIRDRTKSIGTLRSGVDADGRIRTSYNVASTETGRWSSSENAFGTGTNLQNITEKLRRILVADDGFKLAYIDLEQAESRAVALLMYDCLLRMEAWCLAFGLSVPEVCLAKELYLDACESGDLHTMVCLMTWPELPWTDNLEANKKIADDSNRPFYRDFTYRDIAKRLGHGSNYRGSPFGIAQVVGGIEAKVVEAFQKKYFGAFPLEAWHKDVVEKVQIYGHITTPLGRRRQFFGRRSDDATHREAIAFQPQSMVGDLLNLGLWRAWNSYYDPRRGFGSLKAPVQFLAQVHDAVVIQYKEHLEAEVLAKVPKLIQVPVTLGSRTMKIPTDTKVGWNFSKVDEKKKLWQDGNPDGLIGYKGNDARRRNKAPGLLDRAIR